MYIGTTSARGLHHLVYEVVDNSVDEAMAGEPRGSSWRCMPTTASRCRTTGRHPGQADPEGEGTAGRRVEVALTTLNAGGKFGGYRISGGLHGVGVSVVNALSERMTAEIQRDGFTWAQAYARGRSTGKLTKGRASKKTGTTIRFWPDPESSRRSSSSSGPSSRSASASSRS